MQNALNKLEKELENVKISCLLGLIQLEKAWNPNDWNSSNRYRLLKEEFDKSCRHSLYVVQQKLAEQTIFQAKCHGCLRYEIFPEESRFLFRYDTDEFREGG